MLKSRDLIVMLWLFGVAHNAIGCGRKSPDKVTTSACDKNSLQDEVDSLQKEINRCKEYREYDKKMLHQFQERLASEEKLAEVLEDSLRICRNENGTKYAAISTLLQAAFERTLKNVLEDHIRECRNADKSKYDDLGTELQDTFEMALGKFKQESVQNREHLRENTKAIHDAKDENIKLLKTSLKECKAKEEECEVEVESSQESLTACQERVGEGHSSWAIAVFVILFIVAVTVVCIIIWGAKRQKKQSTSVSKKITSAFETIRELLSDQSGLGDHNSTAIYVTEDIDRVQGTSVNLPDNMSSLQPEEGVRML